MFEALKWNSDFCTLCQLQKFFFTEKNKNSANSKSKPQRPPWGDV
jgi:hypothetical protein